MCLDIVIFWILHKNSCFDVGGTVTKLTMMMQHSDIKNAGNIPGTTSSSCTDMFFKKEATPSLSHIITVAAPDTIPAIAPHIVVRFHQRDNIIKGPNDAASPPHAKATRK